MDQKDIFTCLSLRTPRMLLGGQVQFKFIGPNSKISLVLREVFERLGGPNMAAL